MNRFTGSLLYKILALMLYFILGAGAIFSGTCLLFFAMDGYYSGETETYSDSSICKSQLREDCYDALYTYINTVESSPEYRRGDFAWPVLSELSVYPGPESTNFRFALYGEEGILLAGNIAPGEEVGSPATEIIHLWESAVALDEEAEASIGAPTDPSPSPMPAEAGELPASLPIIDEETGQVLSTLPPTLTAVPRTVEGEDTFLGSLGTEPLPTLTPTPAPIAVSQAEASQVPPRYLAQGERVPRRQEFRMEGYLLTGLPLWDSYAQQAKLFDRLWSSRNSLSILFVLSLLGLLLLTVYLCAAAGRRKEEDRPRAGFFHRIWLEIWIVAVSVGVVLFAMAGVFCLEYAQRSLYLGLWAALVCFSCIPLLLILFLMTLAARIRTRTLLSSTLVAWCWKKILSLFGWIRDLLRGFWKNRRLLTRALLILFGILALESILFGLAREAGFFLLLFFLFNGALLFLFCRLVLQGEQLYRAAERMQAGDFSKPVDTETFYPALRAHGIHLNSLGLGISRAVDARMKSERMKTDLITNVSHDLKTPLTSIVNYVDLLKQAEPGSDQAREYLSVLDRQSQRLKKLAEDLVAASKASSGVLQVDLAPTDLKETVHQCLGEYTERYASANLTLIPGLPEQEIFALGDGRLLWRVMDNLLSNALKYSLPGTRVYVDLISGEKEGYITVKNISREPLNIPAEELKERFVRGDASRSTSGSGLGLSIAENLMTCMGGRLELSINGDLFTARVALPKVG